MGHLERSYWKQVLPMQWICKKRLSNIRDNLHDPIKDCMFDLYAVHFGATPFAHHGAPPGTTGRLNAWLGSLAKCINDGVFNVPLRNGVEVAGRCTTTAQRTCGWKHNRYLHEV